MTLILNLIGFVLVRLGWLVSPGVREIFTEVEQDEEHLSVLEAEIEELEVRCGELRKYYASIINDYNSLVVERDKQEERIESLQGIVMFLSIELDGIKGVPRNRSLSKREGEVVVQLLGEDWENIPVPPWEHQSSSSVEPPIWEALQIDG